MFVNLHLHSHFSLYDGAMSPSNIAEECNRERHTACALTDHGTMGGYYAFHQTMLSVGVKPIAGCEFYLATGPKTSSHLTVLAQSTEGYRNLITLHNISHRPDHFYYKPRVFWSDLERHSKGLIVLSGCLAGHLSKLILADKWLAAKSMVERFRRVFGSRFFLEVQPHLMPEQIKLNECLFELGKRYGIPCVATSDSHHSCSGYDVYKAVLLDKAKGDINPQPFGSVRTASLLPPSTLAMTCEIAESCQPPNLKTDRIYFPIVAPDRLSTMISSSYLWISGKSHIYKNRLDYEISVISTAGFLPYFYVLWDLKKWSDSKQIFWGYGRGSAAGSLFSYCLGITAVDPIFHNLLFERFLNPDRISPPDIDIDIQHDRRGECIEYLKEKYGEVYGIATYQRSKYKTAIKDICRSLGMSPKESQDMADIVPASVRGVDPSHEDSDTALIASGVSLPMLGKIKALVGKPRSQGSHAAGVVIRPDGSPPLPILRNDVAAWEMGDIESAGYIKFDVLGLKTATLVSKLKKMTGKTYSPSDWSQDITMLFSGGNTHNVFQLESSGATEFIKRYKPKNIHDLSEIIALYRPGPLDSGIADEIIEIRNGKVKRDSPLFVYQEQVMQYARDNCGYTLAEADMLRKAIGKKKPEELAKHKDRFRPEVWESIEKFGAYCFNASHAISYAYMSYQTAAYKARHPLHFALACLEVFAESKTDKIKTILSTRCSGIKLIPPTSISHWDSEIVGGGIRLGCRFLKGFKKKPVRETPSLKKALALASGNFSNQVDVFGVSLTPPKAPSGQGIFLHAESRTSLAGRNYHMLILDSGSSWKEQFSWDKPDLFELVKIYNR